MIDSIGSLSFGWECLARGCSQCRDRAGCKQPGAPFRSSAARVAAAAIEIAVVGKDSGKRLPNATVRCSIDFETSDAKTDRNGVVRLDLTKRTFQDVLSFDVWADGYVQQRFFFAQDDAATPESLRSSRSSCCPAKRPWAARSSMKKANRSKA